MGKNVIRGENQGYEKWKCQIRFIWLMFRNQLFHFLWENNTKELCKSVVGGFKEKFQEGTCCSLQGTLAPQRTEEDKE